METINTKTLKVGDILTPKGEHEAGFKPGQCWTLDEIERTKPTGAAVAGYKLKNVTGAIQKVRPGALFDKWLLTSHSELQARAQFKDIAEKVKALTDAVESKTLSGNEHADAIEQAQTAINEDPLSIEVRSDWWTLDQYAEESKKPSAFKILLCTGGPAVQIIGELNEYCEPESARIEHQDWGTPWTEYRLTADEQETLLEYCRQFYFGE